MRYLLLFVTLCALHSGYGQPLTGSVFEDKNNNGRLDRGERLLPGAGISDGDTIVWSDRHGRYSLPSTEGTRCFVIAPNGYTSRPRGIQNPALITAAQRAAPHNFALHASASEATFRVAVVGDIQVDSPEQLGFASRTILSEIASRNDLDLWIHMGDLANDKPALLREALSLATTITTPLWCVVGNHDLDIDFKPRTGAGFREMAGSDVAAFYRGKTCFVVLNNVEETEPGLPASQLRFLKNLVTHTPKQTLFVICQHVPMGEMANRDKLFDILSEHKTLILSAHAHRIFRKEWMPNISEVSVGAACGSWWTGERDAWGIPIALQQCGSPRNYFLFDFQGNNYTFRYKGVGLDPNIQAEVWVKGENATDNEVPEPQQEPAGTIVVNLYGGGESSRIEYTTDSITWHPLQPTKLLAPPLSRMIYMNKNGGYPTKFSRRQPVRKMVSPHIWRGTLPDSLHCGAHILHFRVTDDRGFTPFGFSRTVHATQN